RPARAGLALVRRRCGQPTPAFVAQPQGSAPRAKKVKSVTVTSLLIAVVLGVFAYEYFSLPDVSTLRKRNPGSTALMELREEESRRRGARVRREQAWVPYDSVSEHLKRAILVSEDAAF